MGGKSGGQDAPPAIPTQALQAQQDQMTQLIQGMMGQQAGMMQMSMQNRPQMPDIPAEPGISRTPEVDWSEKNKQLAQKARADFGVNAARRKGRADTVLTSPLLDDEDATTTSLVAS